MIATSVQSAWSVQSDTLSSTATLRDADGLVGILAVANLKDPLNDLERVPVRTQQILEETHSVVSHRRDHPTSAIWHGRAIPILIEVKEAFFANRKNV